MYKGLFVSATWQDQVQATFSMVKSELENLFLGIPDMYGNISIIRLCAAQSFDNYLAAV